MNTFRLFPEQASTIASRVDAIFFWEGALYLVLAVVIFFLVVYMCIVYRHGSSADRTPIHANPLTIELTWTIVPTLLTVGMFYYGAVVFQEEAAPPPGALEIHVVGKQWMWKIQHPGGQEEINELHVPRGVPVKLVLTSEDVIHDFFIPDFRIKQDILPDRVRTEWFEATRDGDYHLFCAQYCGFDHSRMGGRVVVMEPSDYEKWLASHSARPVVSPSTQALPQKQGVQASTSIPQRIGRPYHE